MLRSKRERLKVLTWHVHGNYLYYLTQANCIFYIPVKNSPVSGYFGKTPSFPWGDNVIEVPFDEVKNLKIDCILFQSNFNPKQPTKDYLREQKEILSEQQLQHVPKLFVEHDPPRSHPTDTKHPIDDPDIQLIHVTHFNQLMWDSGRTPTTVIDHGVLTPPQVAYTGEIEKGIVVINGLASRGRRLGLDIFEKARKSIPIDLVGMRSEEIGGIGEIQPQKLHEFISHYRFFFNPIRYTSLGLALCEAMTIGMPIVGLATTELAVTIENGKTGFIHTDIDWLIEKMRFLLKNPHQAKKMGDAAKQYAKRFAITRFVNDWENIFAKTVSATSSFSPS